jgi:hypothetical protein
MTTPRKKPQSPFKKARSPETAAGGTAKPKAKPAAKSSPTKPKKIPPQYRGMRGVRHKRQKDAVDALCSLVAVLADPPVGAKIEVYGTYAKGRVDDGGEAGKPFDAWQVDGLSISVENADGTGWGSDWMRAEPDHLDVLAAAEDVLRTAHIKRKTVGDDPDDVIDDAGEAREVFKRLWNMPGSERMRRHECYLLWLVEKKPDLSLVDALASRPSGFYGDQLGKLLHEDAASLSGEEYGHLRDYFDVGAARPPHRVYEVKLKGSDQVTTTDGVPRDPLTKRIQVQSGDLLTEWLTETGLKPHVMTMYDVASSLAEAGHEDAAEQILRGKLGQDFDLILSKEGNRWLCTEETLRQPHDWSPAPAWIEASEHAVAARKEAATDAAEREEFASGGGHLATPAQRKEADEGSDPPTSPTSTSGTFSSATGPTTSGEDDGPSPTLLAFCAAEIAAGHTTIGEAATWLDESGVSSDELAQHILPHMGLPEHDHAAFLAGFERRELEDEFFALARVDDTHEDDTPLTDILGTVTAPAEPERPC